MERLRRSWIRLTTVLISAAAILAAIAGHDTILSDRVHLDDFSYIDCLSALDEASNHVTDERYEMSLKCVQYARKNCMRMGALHAA
jgi:hypothetical protein